MKINYTFEIDAVSAFQMLCKTLKMDFVLDEDTDFRYHKGKVYVMRNGQEKIYDDRGDLFVALRNVAVNFIPNTAFRGAEYIYQYDEDEDEELKRVPSVQTVQKTGRWIDDNCSECGQYVYHGDANNYCPNCGAKMESENKKT